MTLELKEAVGIAKAFVVEVFKGEAINGIGLDEVTHDDKLGRWLVTIGFYRTDDGNNLLNLTAPKYRHYKRVVIDDSEDHFKAGRVLAVENRAVAT